MISEVRETGNFAIPFSVTLQYAQVSCLRFVWKRARPAQSIEETYFPSSVMLEAVISKEVMERGSKGTYLSLNRLQCFSLSSVIVEERICK